uniref:Uncharacterized protein n=1 Tax=Cucumis melo TaxID=3656 RepID=A0A9I9CYL4_CUCME
MKGYEKGSYDHAPQHIKQALPRTHVKHPPLPHSSIPLLLTSRRPSPSHVQHFHSPFGDDDCPTASTEQPIQADRPQAMYDYNQHVGCLEARLDRMDVFLQKL